MGKDNNKVSSDRMKNRTFTNHIFDSRYNNWTAPEYYEQATSNFQKELAEKEKREQLQARRDKLKQLLSAEQEMFNFEIEDKKNLKSKKVSCDVLRGIDQNIKDMQSENRRQELESQLYKRWRIGTGSPDRNKIILESKNDHQTMAKLNWMDKKIEQHVQREQEKKESEIRQIKIQEGARQHEEYLTQCKIIRDSEIKELKSLQENNVSELKSREKECNYLRFEEDDLCKKKEELEEKLKILESNLRNRKNRIVKMFNVTRVKTMLRQRSDEIRTDLQEDINILIKLSYSFDGDSKINKLVTRFQSQFESELQKQTLIESMYDSEAKAVLTKQEELWTQQTEQRSSEISSFIQEKMIEVDNQLRICLVKQKELISIKEAHLQSIENLNQRLKNLLCDESSERVSGGRNEIGAGDNSLIHRNGVEKVTNQMEKCFIQNDDLIPPKFGRRKVAWN